MPRRPRRALALALAAGTAALGLLGPPALPAVAQPVRPAQAVAPGAGELARLQAALDAATARSEQLASAVEQSAARAGALRTTIARLAQEQERAREVVGARARAAYVAGAPAQDPLAGLLQALAAPDLRGLADAELGRRAGAAAVRSAQDLADAVATSSAAAQQLREQTAAYRARLQADADAALAAQEQARRLLDQAQQALAAEQSRRQEEAAASAIAALQAQLAQVRGRLDAASSAVTLALTPAQTARTRRAAQDEGPVLAAVEAAGAGYPQGYRPTGVVLAGEASWYGPGFVGNPTASGAPYDPERLTCAHRTLPLGTVVHVVSGGRAVNCLVNDRGPYVDGRILDMSRAGSRALGYDGVAPVTVEVLAPAG